MFIQRSSGVNVRVVRSLTDHWSVVVNANVGHAEFNNQDLTAGGRASLEYNFFKWKEATQHQFILANTTTERWGSVDLSASFSQYLHDLSKTNLSLGGGVDLRITKGLSVSIGGSAASVHDQIFLARGDLSVEDILTRQRALATSFSYFSFVGLSYTFGSIYNTIVNPRLDKLTGGSSFFFSM